MLRESLGARVGGYEVTACLDVWDMGCTKVYKGVHGRPWWSGGGFLEEESSVLFLQVFLQSIEYQHSPRLGNSPVYFEFFLFTLLKCCRAMQR